jgi:predicted DsbA family dithiol-disulfide isomerase
VEVFFDFACPYCYLAWSFLGRLGMLEGDLKWSPWMIRPDVPQGGLRRRWPLLDELRRIGSDAEVPFAELEIIPNTRRALLAYLWADQRGLSREALKATFLGFFAQGRDIGDPRELCALYAEGGLPDPSQAFEDVALMERLGQLDVRAEAIGVEVVPSFVEGDRVVLSWRTSFVMKDLAEFMRGRGI